MSTFRQLTIQMKLHVLGSTVLAFAVAIGAVVSASAQSAITQNNLLLNPALEPARPT